MRQNPRRNGSQDDRHGRSGIARLAWSIGLGWVLITSLVFTATAEDWTGWMGNQRDGVYRGGEVGSLADADVLWRMPIGGGYAGPAVADGRVYVFDYQLDDGKISNDPGRRVNLRGAERLWCYSTNGEMLWQRAYTCPYSISYPAGPRCTPTVDGDRVYTLGAEGDLKCFAAHDGRPIWSRSLKRDFAAEVPIWGFSAHPLIDGDLLYTMVGGPGQGVVAMDKMTGEVRWKSLDARAGYCPPSILEAGGRRQLLVYHPTAVVGLDPISGDKLWDVPAAPMYDMSITRPMIESGGNPSSDETRMYVSGIRTEALMMRIDTDGGVSELWRGEPKSAVHCANSTPLFVDGVVYGTDCNDGSLMAIDADNGDRLWTTFQPTKPDEKRFARHGTAFLTRIGQTDRYLLMSEIGDLVVARLTRDEYRELSRTHVLEPTGEAFGRSVVWSHPAYADGVAYLRNDEEIVAVRIAAN